MIDSDEVIRIRNKMLHTNRQSVQAKLKGKIECLDNGCIAADECESWKSCKLYKMYLETIVDFSNQLMYEYRDEQDRIRELKKKTSKKGKLHYEDKRTKVHKDKGII